MSANNVDDTIQLQTGDAFLNENQSLDEIGAKLSWPSPFVEDFHDPEWPNFDASDELVLEWVMKNKRFLFRTITWNLCAKLPPSKEVLQKSLLVKK